MTNPLSWWNIIFFQWGITAKEKKVLTFKTLLQKISMHNILQHIPAFMHNKALCQAMW